MRKKFIPTWAQVLQQPNTPFEFHRKELYAPTVHYPLASIPVQLEGYLGLVVRYPTYAHSQNTSV